MTALRVVTWNVHGFVGLDGERDVERTAAVLRDAAPDIAGLQEVDCRGPLPDGTDRLARVAARTGLHPTFGPTIHTQTGRFGNALLTRWPATNVSSHDLSVAGGERRGILSADVRVPDRRVRVVVTHFGLRAAERRRQVELLLDLVGTLGETPVLVMGDFNEWRPRAGTIRRLNAVLGRGRGVRSFPSRCPLLALDRIWVRPQGVLVEVAVHARGAARVASDHLPVTARIAFDR